MIDWFLRGALRLYRSNLKILIPLSTQKSSALRDQDHWEEALAMMESVAHIEPSDYAAPSLVITKLQWRFAGIDPVAALAFFLELNTLLFRSGRQELAIQLLELEVGLSPKDYSDPERISLRLQQRLQGFGPDQVFAFGFKLATTLGHGERTEEGLAVVKALLSLRPGDFSDVMRLSSHLKMPPEGVDLEQWLGAIFFLLWLLEQVGRRDEGIAIFEATFGITQADYSSAEQLRKKVLVPPGSELLAIVVAGILFSFWRFSAALVLIELVLEIRPEDYRDPTILAERQRKAKKCLPLEVYDLSLLTLLTTLVVEDRAGDAMVFFMSDVGLSLADLAESVRVVSQLRARCLSMQPNAAARYVFAASLVLTRAGFAEAATVALEADVELESLDWEDRFTLAAAIDERLGELSPTARLMYILQTSVSLSEAGRERKAALLVDAYVRALSPLAGREEDPYMSPILCGIFEIWLRDWAQDSSRQPLELCRDLVPYLRESLARQGVWLEDRTRFVREVGDLRRRIVQTGLYWASRETNPAQADEIRRTVLLWDLELSQRLIVERFLLNKIRVLPAGASPGTGTWPLLDEEPATSSHLPEASETFATAGVLHKVEEAQRSTGVAEPISHSH